MSKEIDSGIDQDARAALGAAGERLMDRLDVMRAEEIGSAGALDPEAKLALRKRGDSFLDELEAKRVALQVKAGAKQGRRFIGWGGVAAALLVALVVFKLAAPPLVEPEPIVLKVPDAQYNQPGLPVMDSPAVPEPGTGVLALLGGLMLVLRRQR